MNTLTNHFVTVDKERLKLALTAAKKLYDNVGCLKEEQIDAVVIEAVPDIIGEILGSFTVTSES